jgi:hypothetical protein
VDVFPNGEARNLTDGILRMRYRHGLDKPELAEPGKVYPLNIDAGVTSNVFLAGHSIRVEISSSNFPRFDRNPNTGRAFADETTLKKAQQMVYHSRQYPSHVLLPVIPARERKRARHGPELTSASAARYGAKRSPVWKPSPSRFRRGSQVVRQRSAKPLFVTGSTPRASNNHVVQRPRKLRGPCLNVLLPGGVVGQHGVVEDQRVNQL